MHRLYPLVPSAHALYVFEAAARRGSFSAAAQELNVSQPAVSKTIRALEKSTGLCLFARGKRRAELTLDGEKLFREVSAALEQIYGSISALRTQHTGDTIKVSVSAALLHLWLLPRIGRFRQRFPDIPLRLEESDQENRDLMVNNIDISTRLGTGVWPGVEAHHFVAEQVIAVCSPTYLAERGPIRDLPDLLHHKLLHFEEPHRARISWRDWFRHNGIDATGLQSDFVFTDSKGALDAAVFGQGITLSWTHLAGDHLRDGRLVLAVERRVTTGLSFYVVTPRDRALKRGARQFRDWLIEEIERDFPPA